MNLLTVAQRLGLVTRSDQSGMLPTISPQPRTTGPVDPMSLDAVYRAVQILQTGAKQLTLDVWRGADPVKNKPTWITRPDPWKTTPAFIAETVASLALRGNAYWRVVRSDQGVILSLEVLDPLEIRIRPPARGSGPNRYEHGDEKLGPRDVAHLALLRRPGRKYSYGLGPIQACQTTIDGAAQLRSWADQWITQSTVPNGILSTEQQITQGDATQLKKRFLDSVKATEPVVLGHGVSYKPLLLTPNEMQWLDSQDFNIIAIARLFGIPPRLMLVQLDGSSTTYANQQQEDLSFVRWTLMAYLSEIEDAITWLLPRGLTARFNLDAVLRADTATRYQAHAVGISSGFLTLDEVRAIEGLPPLTPTESEPR